MCDRDATKRARGAERIAEIAHHVVDNSGPLSALKFTVNRIVSATDLPKVALHASGPETQSEWLGQATDHVLDDQVALVLATGSTGTASWRVGWSDLDLLVVRDTAPAAWLRGVAGALLAPEDIKVGLSVFTAHGSVDARWPPRACDNQQLARWRRRQRPVEIEVATSVTGGRAGRLGCLENH